jgi:pyrroline-5-carboxylate reductase
MYFSEKRATIHLIGCGRMGSAILAAWIKKGYPLRYLSVKEPNPSDWLIRQADRGLSLNRDIQEADYCFLAIKPQNLFRIEASLELLSKKSVTFVSLLAGITIDRIIAVVGEKEAVVRIMPNLPAEVGKGVTALIENNFVSKRSSEELFLLLNSFGTVVKLSNEDKLDAVTAISGSGPAYIFLLAELMIKEAIKMGINQEDANHLTKNTILGAGELMIASELTAEELRENVTSPGGTTQAALSFLMREKGGLPDILSAAITAAAKKSKHLSKN